jgi:hypothetical protein
MHSTRIATFLLGAWIGGCLFADLLAIENVRLASSVMSSAIPPAVQIIQKAGRQEVASLLRYFAAEQYRSYFSAWELIQIPGALLAAGLLYFAAEKRAMPQILCGLMLALVLFQLAIHPELAYRGREADFPPGSQLLGAEARLWVLLEVWAAAEAAKLAAGVVLASYLFTYKSRKRVRRAVERLDHAADAQRLINQT